MKKRNLIGLVVLMGTGLAFRGPGGGEAQAWIRINWLGYRPQAVKVAVWCSKEDKRITDFVLVDSASGAAVFKNTAGRPFGAWGPFAQTYRLDFSAFHQPGTYWLRAGDTRSPCFQIGEDVYKGAADFCLRYMRQQRSGFNPFLKDSCHTHDGYTMYGPMPDSTHIDVVGGWHDASDYLQYVTTSANATYHLLAAYRDFPQVFDDTHLANGLAGGNGRADVLDEAKWGLDWLEKMHPGDLWFFNQVGDDRDHYGMRLPGEDSVYGKGYERPVYFCTGKPQGLFRYKNHSTGVASTAGKFGSAFALGSMLFENIDSNYASRLLDRSGSSLMAGMAQPGVCQTAPGRAPYYYAEDNWTDDMELAATAIYEAYKTHPHPGQRYRRNGEELNDTGLLTVAREMARREPVTPWLGTDTAAHYQWYPFINIGHYELARQLEGKARDSLINYYRVGVERVWARAKQNAFYHGIPFIWCSNNLTTSFAIQCYWYRALSGDSSYIQLEQACFDWLFGCNPWGTGFVYGLPQWGDTPTDPHSSLSHLKNYPVDGGLVDGPVYGSIYKKLIGITLHHPDAYADFQSDLAVYHDDYGDYSTNEPTMDGTASLVYLLAAEESGSLPGHLPKAENKGSEQTQPFTRSHGAIIRGDSSVKKIALVFTGDQFAEGGDFIARLLREEHLPASFFLTGNFYRNRKFRALIEQLKKDGQYLGPHSNKHLLYCDWTRRDSLLVTHKRFLKDLHRNYAVMKRSFGISKKDAPYFLPPYEWYNDSIAAWAKAAGLQLVCFTPGTRSNADYTTPDMKNYRSSATILQSVTQYESSRPGGLNGFILLMHMGAGPGRNDKLYNYFPDLFNYLRNKGYKFVRVDALLE